MDRDVVVFVFVPAAVVVTGAVSVDDWVMSPEAPVMVASSPEAEDPPSDVERESSTSVVWVWTDSVVVAGGGVAGRIVEESSVDCSTVSDLEQPETDTQRSTSVAIRIFFTFFPVS